MPAGPWKVHLDTPETIKVPEYWARMRTERLIKTDPDFQNGWYADLQAGHIATWVSAQWGDAILSGNAPATAGKWRVAPMPQLPFRTHWLPQAPYPSGHGQTPRAAGG